MHAAPDYLNPDLPIGLRHVRMPIVDATVEALEGYGLLVDDPERCPIEIVRWPAQGTRPVDADTGDQGGTTEGVFVSQWRGDVLQPARQVGVEVVDRPVHRSHSGVMPAHFTSSAKRRYSSW